MGHSTGSTVAIAKEQMTTAPSELGRRRQNFKAQAKVNRSFKALAACRKALASNTNGQRAGAN